jgi:hypothetical protein
VLYRNFHEISQAIFLVEISRDSRNVFVLLFENFENPTSYKAEVLREKIALKLMQESANSFETFVSKFYIKFGRLQIQGYHGKPQT